MYLNSMIFIFMIVQAQNLVKEVVLYWLSNFVAQESDLVVEDIICPKCTLKVPITGLDAHISGCKYTVCVKCEQYFPTEIIEDHQE
jgi:hypothetical protein